MEQPNDLKAERAILKVALLKPELFEHILSSISSKMFDSGDNQIIFRALSKMHEDGIGLETTALKGYMKDSYDRVGGDDLFDAITTVDALPSNLDQYLKVVKDSYTRRTVINAGIDVAEFALKSTNPTEAVARLIGYTDNIINDMAAGTEVVSLEDLKGENLALYEYRKEHPGFGGIKTGLRDYDMVIGGLQPTHLTYVAARPSMGKTSILLTVLLNIARQGTPVLLFSYEMSPEQIFYRLVSLESSVSYQKIAKGMVNEEENEAIEFAFERVAGLPFYLTYATAMGIDEASSLTTKLVRTKGVRVVGLDYVQLLCSSDNMNAELTYVSRTIKLNALKNNISWWAASQLNRKVEMRENKRPILSDLRDSGSLEQDADIVVMLYRDHLYNPVADNERDAEIAVVKNRHGPIATFMSDFDKHSMRFTMDGNYG